MSRSRVYNSLDQRVTQRRPSRRTERVTPQTVEDPQALSAALNRLSDVLDTKGEAPQYVEVEKAMTSGNSYDLYHGYGSRRVRWWVVDFIAASGTPTLCRTSTGMNEDVLSVVCGATGTYVVRMEPSDAG